MSMTSSVGGERGAGNYTPGYNISGSNSTALVIHPDAPPGSNNVGMVVGLAVGGILLGILLVIIFLLLWRRRTGYSLKHPCSQRSRDEESPVFDGKEPILTGIPTSRHPGSDLPTPTSATTSYRRQENVPLPTRAAKKPRFKMFGRSAKYVALRKSRRGEKPQQYDVMEVEMRPLTGAGRNSAGARPVTEDNLYMRISAVDQPEAPDTYGWDVGTMGQQYERFGGALYSEDEYLAPSEVPSTLSRRLDSVASDRTSSSGGSAEAPPPTVPRRHGPLPPTPEDAARDTEYLAIGDELDAELSAARDDGSEKAKEDGSEKRKPAVPKKPVIPPKFASNSPKLKGTVASESQLRRDSPGGGSKPKLPPKPGGEKPKILPKPTGSRPQTQVVGESLGKKPQPLPRTSSCGSLLESSETKKEEGLGSSPVNPVKATSPNRSFLHSPAYRPRKCEDNSKVLAKVESLGKSRPASFRVKPTSPPFRGHLEKKKSGEKFREEDSKPVISAKERKKTKDKANELIKTAPDRDSSYEAIGEGALSESGSLENIYESYDP